MYVCGPTVYGPPHLGHGRFSLVFDVLRRYLRWSGLEVTYVSNITDIDDKIIQRANDEGRDPAEIAVRCEDVWWEAMEAIGVDRPDHDPHATAYVPEMVALIAELIDRGDAYVSDDGVYFSPVVVDDYGLLARQSLESLQAGARVEVADAQAVAHRLRPLEVRQAGRAGVALAVGRRPPRLAHRVRGDVARPARRRLRHPRRRPRPRLPAPRERAGPGRGRGAHLRPPLGAQRLRRGRRREDVEEPRQLHQPPRPDRLHRPACLPAAGAAGPLPHAARDLEGHHRRRRRGR